MNYDIKDLNLAKEGKQRIYWADRFMPVLAQFENNLLKKDHLKVYGLQHVCM